MINNKKIILLMLFLLGFSKSALAATCNVTTTGLNFGSYDVYSLAPNITTASITVNCSPANTSFSIALNPGLYGNFEQRQMSLLNENDRFFYNIYTNNSYSIVWGDGTGNTSTVSAMSNTPIPVYAVATGGQDVTKGSYSDTITVTVSF